MKVLLLKGQGQYGTLRLHIDQVSAAFNRMGITTVILDLTEPETIDFQKLSIEKFSLIFSINVGADVKIGNDNIAQVFDIPHYILYVDHPSDQFERCRSTTQNHIISFLDRSHARWFNTMFPRQAGAVCVIPPGANISEKSYDDINPDQFLERRNIPVLFTGTIRQQSSPAWRQEPDSEGKQILEAAYELATSKNAMPLDQALKVATTSLFGGYDKSILNQLYPLAQYLHNHIHSIRRYEALCALADADIPVWVYGKGWTDHLSRFQSFHYKGEGSFDETLELLKKTRLVLNTNTNFVEGAHERIFAAQAAGAAVISDRSSWLEEKFTDGLNIQFFDWNPEINVAEKVSSLINNPEAIYQIAKNGRKETLKNHLWENRIEMIFDIAKQCAAWKFNDQVK